MTEPNKKSQGLESVKPLTPFFAAAGEPRSRSQPAFNPQNAFGSITSGRQQFTILGDTDHGDPSIVQAVSDNIPAMAKSGVKHLMIEYPPNAQMENLLQGLYAKPQKISDEEMRKSARLFESANARTPEARQESGRQFAELLINAHKNGIRVHFAGDELGTATHLQILDVQDRQNKFAQEQPAMHDMFLKYLEGGDKYLRSAGVSEDQIGDVSGNLLAHGEKYLSLGKRLEELNTLHEQVRMGPGAEGERAERFIRMAGGEKSVVMFGADHVGNRNDMNEALDGKLRAEALKKGTAADFEPTKVIGVYASREAEKNSPPITVANDANYFQKERCGELTETGAQSFTSSQAAQLRPEVQLKR